MLAKFLYQFTDYFIGFNVFRYITVRAALAAITALILSWWIGPKVIRLLKKHQIGLVGFIDDYLKSIKKLKKGLIGRYKLLGQISVGLFLGLIIYFHPFFEGIHSNTSVPFFKNLEIDFGWFYILFIIFVLTGSSNAVNLTDGLDGLAAGLSAIAFIALAGMAYVTSNVKFSDYLKIIYLSGTEEIAVFCMAVFGAAMGFLWFNAYPAEVFMGDTGSLALGTAMGAAAILLKKELLLLLIAGVFIAEAMSVIIQTTYFKYTRKKYGQGKRVFKMAPVHHHFELKGWHETKVVIRFWIVGILLALLSLSTFKTQ